MGNYTGLTMTYGDLDELMETFPHLMYRDTVSIEGLPTFVIKRKPIGIVETEKCEP